MTFRPLPQTPPGRDARKINFPVTAVILMASLPFMQLLTIDIGFPLKIYELAIALWALTSFVSLNVWMFDPKLLASGLLLSVYAVLALIINLDVLSNEGPYTYLARFSPLGDGLLKCGYMLFCVLGFNLVAYASAMNPRFMTLMWLRGAAVSAVIQFILFAMSAVNLPMPAIPGMREVPAYMSVDGMMLYRAATFLEGNYAGPFFILSFLIARSLGRTRLGIFFLVAAATTFSTTALAGLIVAIGYILVKQKDFSKKYVLLIVTALALLASSPFLDTIVFDKFADTSDQSSAIDRQHTAETAAQMFITHPLIGVGLAQYGLHTPGVMGWDFTLKRMGSESHKTIANNVYAEMAAELGLIGLGFLSIFVFLIYKTAVKVGNVTLQAGLIAILIFWISSPTITMMYYWAFFGLLCGMGRNRDLMPQGAKPSCSIAAN